MNVFEGVIVSQTTHAVCSEGEQHALLDAFA